jgi:hypothetical protein
VPTGGRLIKTHEAFRKEYQKAIYLVRDVRDVILSEYRYRKMRYFYAREFDDFLDEFLNGKVSGLGSWTDHVTSWLDAGASGTCPSLLVVKYEDLRHQPEETLSKMATFVGIRRDAKALREIVQNNAIEKMRDQEDRARGTLLKHYRQDLRHVNQGAIGGWRDVLRDDQVQKIQQTLGAPLARLGYTA